MPASSVSSIKQPQLLDRVDRLLALAGLKPSSRRTQLPVPFMTAISGRASLDEDVQRPRDPQGDVVLGACKRDRLGDQLAEDDVHEGDEQESERRSATVWTIACRATPPAARRTADRSGWPGPARRPSPGAMLASVMPSCVAAMVRSRFVDGLCDGLGPRHAAG